MRKAGKKCFRERHASGLREGIGVGCAFWVIYIYNMKTNLAKTATCALLATVLINSSQAVTLGLGDIAFSGYQATAPDKVAFVLLKNVDSGTVVTFTDNAWSSTGALLATEGNSVLTFGGSFTAGTQFDYLATRTAGSRWQVGSSATNLSDTTGTNFALNASGDNVFAYNGTTAPTTGSSSLWITAFASNAFLTTGSQSASLTYLPSAFTLGTNAISLGLANAAANENGAYTSTSISGTAAQISTALNTSSSWTTFTTAGAQAIPTSATFTLTAIPEPSTFAAILGVVALLGVATRRRRSV